MKKRLISIIAIIAIAVVAGYNMYASLNTEKNFSNLVLANVEAQANNYEIGDWGTNWKEYKTICTTTETITIGWDFMLQIAITKTTTTTSEKSVCGAGGGWCLSAAGC